MTEETPPRKKFDRWLATPQAVLRVAILSAMLPVAGWFGGHHWFLDLFNHPQAQYFCFLLLCCLTLAAWRKPKQALVCLALLMIPGVRLAPLYLPKETTQKGPKLRVATYNILGTNTRYSESAEWIRKEQPDFIYLPEANEEWGLGIAPLGDLYPHAVDVFIDGNFGFAFRSKFPVVRHEAPRLGRLEIPLLMAVVATPHGEVTVFGAHPVPPVTEFWADERDLYLNQLAELVKSTQGKVVVLGDLNATRWSSSLTPFFEQGLKDTADGHGYSATWMRENVLMTIPIDHILTRGFSGTIRRATGPALGSDHRPVLADLSW